MLSLRSRPTFGTRELALIYPARHNGNHGRPAFLSLAPLVLLPKKCRTIGALDDIVPRPAWAEVRFRPWEKARSARLAIQEQQDASHNRDGGDDLLKLETRQIDDAQLHYAHKDQPD